MALHLFITELCNDVTLKCCVPEKLEVGISQVKVSDF